MHCKRTSMLAIALAAVFASATHAQTMKYQFKEGDKLHYLMEQKTKSTMSLAGTDIIMKVDATLSLSWQVLKVESNGSAQVKVKVTHSKMVMDSLLGVVEVDSKDKDNPGDIAGKMLGQMNKAIAAMEISGTMLPTGEMKDVKVSDETAKAMRGIPGADKLGDLAHPDNFKDMISGIVFPTGAVAKGKSWTHKTETKSPAGKISADNVYTPEGSVVRDGVTLERIALKPTIKIDADPKAQMKVKSIEGSGYTLFDNKTGRVFESQVNQTKLGSVSVMGLTLDQITEERTSIRLQKPSEVKVEPGKAFTGVKLADDEVVDKVVFTRMLETIAGVSRSFTLERSYEPAITITAPANADKAFADELKPMIEKSLGVTIGKKADAKETVTLDGKEITKLKVQWVERTRTGTATHSNGTSVSFRVVVGLELKIEKAK